MMLVSALASVSRASEEGLPVSSLPANCVSMPRQIAETMHAGDLVLYRAEGAVAPAVLIEPAGGGCWLARDARHARSLLYLGAENIAGRLARVDADLLAEAA